MGGTRPIGLVPPHPLRRRHPCNDMTAQVHVGDGAFHSIINPWHDGGVEWMLRYGDPEVVRFAAADVISSADYLLSSNITAAEAIRRLRLLRAARPALQPKGSDK